MRFPTVVEQGDGRGSRIGFVTVRSLIALLIVIVACVTSLVGCGIQLWVLLKGQQPPSLPQDQMLSNMVFIALGYVFAKTPTVPDQPSAVRRTAEDVGQTNVPPKPL